jgi:hypothetical protein
MWGRLPLRDELFLLAHDDEHGFRPRINLPALGIGLAGAVIADLLIDGAVRVDDGRLNPRGRHDRSYTGDRIADQTLYAVRSTPGAAVRDVIRRSSHELYAQTLAGLISAGILAHTPRRLRRDRLKVAEPAVLVQTRARPRYAVDAIGDPDLATDALCALLRATGLEHVLYLNLSTTELRERLDAITRRIRHRARDPYLHAIPDITTAVDTAIGELATAVYR